MSDSEKREKLLDEINSGRYIKKEDANDSGDKIMLAAMVFMLLFLVVFFIMSLQSLNAFTGIVLIVIAVPVFIKLAKILPSKSYEKGLNNTRDLIRNGEILEAEIESVEASGNMYLIRCSADYKGQKTEFVTPTFATRPVLLESKTIDVYVDPQNVSHYFVDYYKVIPYSLNGKLEDRSELKNEPCDVYDNSAELTGLAGAVSGLLNGVFKKEIEMCVRLLKNGDYLEAEVYDSYDVSGDSSTTYYIKLRYIEPGTKRAHEFLACSGHANIKKLVGTKVRVYINPDDTHEFVVDYIRALEDMGFTVDENDKKRALNMFDIYESGILPARKKN